MHLFSESSLISCKMSPAKGFENDLSSTSHIDSFMSGYLDVYVVYGYKILLKIT